MTKFTAACASVAVVLAAALPAAAQSSNMSEAERAAQAELMRAPSTEGIVTDRASCEYEGGSVMDLTDGTICFVPVRGVAANTKVYDGMGLGVIRCSGNGQFANEVVEGNSYCRVYLTAKQRKKTREELQRELDAMTEAELANGTGS